MPSEESWSGELAISLAGLESVGLGKIHIIKLEEPETKTVRVCPQCGNIPKRNPLPPQYHCETCNKDFNTWHSLDQALPIDKEKGLAIPKRVTEKTLKAELSKIDLTKSMFLVTKHEYGIIALDDKAKRNMQKIGIAIKEFKKAVTFKLVFSKGGAEHLLYICVADDNALRAREIIPMNRVRNLPKDLEVFVEDKTISGAEIKTLMDSIPEVEPKDLVLKTEEDKLQEKIESMTPDIEKIVEKMKEE